jgi:16S rRNA (cytosine1402-N4)-methyltransferase
MLRRCVEMLGPALETPGSVVVDATLGMGGHSEALLEAYPDVLLIGIDRDPQALALAGERLRRFADRVTLVHAVYDAVGEIVAESSRGSASGVLFDLGVSSLQLDEVQRGFAYSVDAPLDMRMDATQGITAAEVLNTYDAPRLARVLRDYGDEKFARRIAEAVARERAKEPFTTSARLVDLIRACIPAPARRTGGHPAKRTFQALRIEVNAELDVLRRAVPAALDALEVGGRIAVLSYHSSEDRIVKHAIGERSRSTAPPDLPFELPEHAPELRLLTRGAEGPDEQELQLNPRAASARLRAAERIRTGRGAGGANTAEKTRRGAAR